MFNKADVEKELTDRRFRGVPNRFLEHVKDLDESEFAHLGTPIVAHNGIDYACNCKNTDRVVNYGYAG